MAKVKVKQVKSSIKRIKNQKLTLEALGLKGIGKEVGKVVTFKIRWNKSCFEDDHFPKTGKINNDSDTVSVPLSHPTVEFVEDRNRSVQCSRCWHRRRPCSLTSMSTTTRPRTTRPTTSSAPAPRSTGYGTPAVPRRCPFPRDVCGHACDT